VRVGAVVGTLDGDAVYRGGFLYWTWDERVNGHAGDNHDVRVVRLPVRLGAGARPTVWAAADPAQGFRDVVLGGREPGEAPDDLFEYQKPAMDVNGRGDVVVVFSRHSYRTRVELAHEVRYGVIYAGEPRARPSVLLKRGTWPGVPNIDDNGKAGIDLAYAQVDPSDDATVWVAHAYADRSVRWFRQIVAAIRP
jgi:hypothetical protein